MSVSAENKALAQYLCRMIGSGASVAKYWDDNHERNVDIMSILHRPCDGVTTVTTLGLSDHSIQLRAGGVDVGVEFLLSLATSCEYVPNMLATCAFNIINSRMTCGPGQVFPGVIEMYRKAGAMKHVLFVPPFLWPLKTQEFERKKVAWLQVIPISDSEYELVRREGSDVLETRFEETQVDVFNIDRESVV